MAISTGATRQDYGAIVRAKAQSRIHSLGTAGRSDRRSPLVVMVTFRVAADGRVASARVTRSSGDAAFDRQAAAAMQALALPPPGGAFLCNPSLPIDVSLGNHAERGRKPCSSP